MTWNVEMTPKKPMSKKDGDLWPLEVATVRFFLVWKGTLVSATMSPPEGVTAGQLQKASEKISHAYRCFFCLGGSCSESKKHHVERWEVDFSGIFVEDLKQEQLYLTSWFWFCIANDSHWQVDRFPTRTTKYCNSKSVRMIMATSKKISGFWKKEGSLNFSNYLQGPYLQDIFRMLKWLRSLDRQLPAGSCSGGHDLGSTSSSSPQCFRCSAWSWKLQKRSHYRGGLGDANWENYTWGGPGLFVFCTFFPCMGGVVRGNGSSVRTCFLCCDKSLVCCLVWAGLGWVGWLVGWLGVFRRSEFCSSLLGQVLGLWLRNFTKARERLLLLQKK